MVLCKLLHSTSLLGFEDKSDDNQHSPMSACSFIRSHPTGEKNPSSREVKEGKEGLGSNTASRWAAQCRTIVNIDILKK